MRPRISLVVLAVFTLACGAPQKRVADLKGRTLLVGSDTTYPPMEFLDYSSSEGGPEFAGFDIDLMREIAKLINVKVEFRSVASFDGAFGELAAKQYDVLISSISITDARKQMVAFSDPYLSVGQVVMVNIEDTTVTAPTDLVNAFMVGVQKGTTGEHEVKKLGVPEDRIRAYEDIQIGFHELTTAEIAAVVTDGPAAAAAVTTMPAKLKIIGEPFTTEQYGIALQPGDSELAAAINAALKELKANGTIDALLKKHSLQTIAKPI